MQTKILLGFFPIACHALAHSKSIDEDKPMHLPDRQLQAPQNSIGSQPAPTAPASAEHLKLSTDWRKDLDDAGECRITRWVIGAVGRDR